jgi:hypothetical protein
MGLYNFQPRFAAPILNGTKRQTIRAFRRHPDKPGRILHLYTGLRRKGATFLGRFCCTWAAPIRIHEDGTIVVDGLTLSVTEREELARRDGFNDHAEMMSFWNGRLPFEGQILGWDPTNHGTRRSTP